MCTDRRGDETERVTKIKPVVHLVLLSPANSDNTIAKSRSDGQVVID